MTEEELRQELAKWLRDYGLDPYTSDALSWGLTKEDAPIAVLKARIAELEAENERLKREADGPFARALKDVMSAYPGFEWHDYPDGITADDIREFFRSDLDETWRIFDASKARIAELEAERDEADRRVGRMQHEKEHLEEYRRSTEAWLLEAKRERGYSHNESFDEVWEKTCAAADLAGERAQKLDEAQARIAELEANNQGRPNFVFVQDDLPSAIAAEVMRLEWAYSRDADITADRYGDIQLAAERVLSKAIKQGRPHEEACLYKVRELLNEIVGDSTTEAQAWTGPRQQGWDDCCAAHAAMATVALQALDQAAAPAVPPGFVLLPVEPTETMEGAFEQAYRAKVADICSPSPTEHPDDGGGPFCYGYRAMIDVANQEGE